VDKFELFFADAVCAKISDIGSKRKFRNGGLPDLTPV